ncbi:MAG: YciI family protein [Myxococcales bacterium]|nr:YciI family protein [Myxococcales bacterium]MCB9606761.1 YciI family protein [Polyangiaceae bacterium]
MRVMVIIKANEASEKGEMPSERLLTEMGAFNEELVKAGIMQAGEGVHPSSAGKRVLFSKTGSRVIDGPFAETKELIAGFWIWKVDSMDQAVEWAQRIPNPEGQEGSVELRQVFEVEEFDEMTPELRAQEERMRAEIAKG